MNPQAILDATAFIAGGTVTSRTGVYKGSGGIAGVKIAFSLPPEAGGFGEDGPSHLSYWDHMRINPDGSANGDLTVFQHTIKMELSVSLLRSELPKAYGILAPFIPLYVAAFAAKAKLNATCSIALLSDAQIVDSIYPDRIALDWTLVATEKEAISYVAA